MFTTDMKDRGLFGKFEVHRRDGKEGPGTKHDGCFLYVLDFSHDPAAQEIGPLLADAYDDRGFHLLAEDIRTRLREVEAS